MKGKYISFILFGGIGLYYFVKGQAATKVTAESLRARNFKLNGLSLQFDLILLLTNLGNSSLTINGIGGQAFVNGKPFANTYANEPFTIPRQSSIEVPVRTVLPFITSGSAIYTELKEFIAGRSLNLVWKGNARALGLSVPLSGNFTINRNSNAI